MPFNNDVTAGMTWVDHLREWDYSITPVFAWLWNVVEFNAARHGPIAYVVAMAIVIFILLSFPPTRGVTKTLLGAIFRGLVMYTQLVFALVTVKGFAFVGRVLLTLFHKCRIWLMETVRRMRSTD